VTVKKESLIGSFPGKENTPYSRPYGVAPPNRGDFLTDFLTLAAYQRVKRKLLFSMYSNSN